MSIRLFASATLLFSALSLPAAAPARTPPPFDWQALKAVIDGPAGEAWISFHPSGRVVVFDRNTKDWKDHRIWMTRLVNGRWTSPVPTPLTADFNGTSPRFSADGKSVLFSSTRPLPVRPAPAPDADKDANIWRAAWNGKAFGKAVPVAAINSTKSDEIEAVEVANGTIYFSSTRSLESNPKNQVDIYRAVPGRKGYAISRVEGISTDNYYESTQYVTPDESLMLFSRGNDPQGMGHDDIYVSYRRAGTWSVPVHLKGDVNSPTYEYGPELTPDGKTLLLTTHRSGQAEIIAVPMPRE